MQAREINDSNTWNQFVMSCTPNTFLQSWEWGQIQKRTGEGVRYIGLFDGEQQIGAALVVIVNARRGKFLLIPHGPLLPAGPAASLPHSFGKADLLTVNNAVASLISYCRTLAKEVGAVALRVAPLLETTPENQQLFSSLGFRPAPIHIHAELTWTLDIGKSDEEILAGMRKTTRHAIKKAQDAGVAVDIISDSSGLDRFWPLYEATKDRHGFVPFSRDFLAAEAEEFAKGGNMYFAIAKHNNQDVAGALLVHLNDTVFYHHGASQKLPTSLPAAQYLHWQSIREGKRRGAHEYNFWGIAPENEPHHPFAGITVFKKGFGGRAIDYMHAQDLPLSLGYWKLWLVDSWRKRKRGF